MQNCRPKYHFRRLDNPSAKIAPGWNFRYSNYFGNDIRTLYKAYGILFVVTVQGKAGKFNFIPFLLNLGAGMALLGITTLICDIIVLYCMKDKVLYREKKYLVVKGQDAYAVGGERSASVTDDEREAILQDVEEMEAGADEEDERGARRRSPTLIE